MNKSQVAIEFVITIGISVFILFLFVAIIQEETIKFNRERELVLVEDLAATLQREFIVAESVNNGYTRTFKIPDTLLGINFTVFAQSQELVVRSVHYESVAALPQNISNVISLKKGVNTIKKEKGVICLNTNICP